MASNSIYCNLFITPAVALLAVTGFAQVANATFFDFSGQVTNCNSLACSLAGISVGDPISGYFEVDTAVSGANSTFIETDIIEAELSVGTIGSGVTQGPFGMTSLTTDANGEIVSGNGELVTTVDTPLGLAEVVVVLNATNNTWIASTTLLNLGEVASGTLFFMRRIDTDDDGIADTEDNCTLVANPTQLDTNGDGFGNICDPDLDNNGSVSFIDYALLTTAFLTVPGDFNWNSDADFNGDNVVSFIDIAIFPLYFLGLPGPSGVAP